MKMRDDDWQLVKYFKQSEFPPRPDMMETSIVFLIDTIRDLFNSPIYITSAWSPGTGHSATSQHYVGKAVDFWVEGIPFKDAVDLTEGFLSAPPRGIGEWDKVGVGIYPHWLHPGFHLDTRGAMTRWGAVTRKGKQIYVSWDNAYEAVL
jgi:uncharacterized protein YcbK (DUF882 family)